jgi:hypothetical protein
MRLRGTLGILAVAIMAGALPAAAADVTGKWASEFDSQIGVQKYVFDLKQDGDKVVGTASFEGGLVSFVEPLDFQGTSIRIEYKGQLSGDEMKLTRQVGEFATEQIVAKRLKP